MIGDIVENVVFDDGYWDEALVFARYEVEKHRENGYRIIRYVESYNPYGKERLYAELEKMGERIIIFASLEDGLIVQRVPAVQRAVAIARCKH